MGRKPRGYVLSRYGEPLIRGSAADIAAALGVTRHRVYRMSERRSPDGLGYEIAKDGVPKREGTQGEEADVQERQWSPSTSPTLRVLRRRREEYDGYEPRWER